MTLSVPQDFLNRLYAINWFSNCAIHTIDKEKILKEISKTKWENHILNERGNFTAQLSLHHSEVYKEWNLLTKALKEKELPQLQETWRQNLAPYDLVHHEILDDLAFNLLSIAILYSYENYVEIPAFFKELFAIYEAGKLPYGIQGKGENTSILVY